MASKTPAINRILYVTGQRNHYQATPTTISGNACQVYSYRMLIASRPDESSPWTIVAYQDGPSVTTKRHISAAEIALNGHN